MADISPAVGSVCDDPSSAFIQEVSGYNKRHIRVLAATYTDFLSRAMKQEFRKPFVDVKHNANASDSAVILC